MASLAIYALCQSGAVPWWSLGIALVADTLATLGITISLPPGADMEPLASRGHQIGDPVPPAATR
jgi:hypothetical protein